MKQLLPVNLTPKIFETITATEVGIGDRTNTSVLGTAVTRGRGKAVVIGRHGHRMGKIVSNMQQVEKNKHH